MSRGSGCCGIFLLRMGMRLSSILGAGMRPEKSRFTSSSRMASAYVCMNAIRVLDNRLFAHNYNSSQSTRMMAVPRPRLRKKFPFLENRTPRSRHCEIHHSFWHVAMSCPSLKAEDHIHKHEHKQGAESTSSYFRTYTVLAHVFRAAM